MKSYLINDLSPLQQHLSEHYQFHQPVKNSNEQCYWQQITKGTTKPLSDERPLSSAKRFFFTEHENLLIFNGEFFRETLPSPEPFVLFGVQSCDLSAISYQDKFFSEDPYYQARRKQCLLVGIDCIEPCENGFCPTVDAGPGVRSHTADLILHPLPNKHWLVIEKTEEGVQSLRGLTLETTHEHHLTQRDQALHRCKQLFADDNYITHGIENINSGKIPGSFWKKLAIQCVGCSGCTTLCPTCSCYGTRSTETEQEPGRKNNIQQRFWDSCLYEGFQREASFHNPTAETGARVQRFWQHKFGNDFFAKFKHYGCVGCGRCEQTCPGVIGVLSVMKRIENAAQSYS